MCLDFKLECLLLLSHPGVPELTRCFLLPRVKLNFNGQIHCYFESFFTYFAPVYTDSIFLLGFSVLNFLDETLETVDAGI